MIRFLLSTMQYLQRISKTLFKFKHFPKHIYIKNIQLNIYRFFSPRAKLLGTNFDLCHEMTLDCTVGVKIGFSLFIFAFEENVANKFGVCKRPNTLQD